MEHLWATASESLSRKIVIKETYFQISETYNKILIFKPLLNTVLKKRKKKEKTFDKT